MDTQIEGELWLGVLNLMPFIIQTISPMNGNPSRVSWANLGAGNVFLSFDVSRFSPGS